MSNIVLEIDFTHTPYFVAENIINLDDFIGEQIFVRSGYAPGGFFKAFFLKIAEKINFTDLDSKELKNQLVAIVTNKNFLTEEEDPYLNANFRAFEEIMKKYNIDENTARGLVRDCNPDNETGKIFVTDIMPKETIIDSKFPQNVGNYIVTYENYELQIGTFTEQQEYLPIANQQVYYEHNLAVINIPTFTDYDQHLIFFVQGTKPNVFEFYFELKEGVAARMRFLIAPKSLEKQKNCQELIKEALDKATKLGNVWGMGTSSKLNQLYTATKLPGINILTHSV